MNLYASLDDLKLEKDVIGADESDNNRLLLALIAASRRIDDYCGRHFYPKLDTLEFDFLSAWEIRFGDHDLVAASLVTTESGDTTIDAADYYLLTGEQHNYPIKDRLLIRSDAAVTLNIGTRTEQANAITGTWCYHDRWADAWRDSLDTVEDDPLTAAATSLTVNDADGADERGITPRFSVGQLLQIEDEWLYVAAVSTTTNALTVTRAQNGSTAAEHVQNTAVSVYQPPYAIWKGCLLAAAYMLELPSAPFGTVQNLEGTYEIPLTLPASTVDLIEPYRRMFFGTASPQVRLGAGRLYPGGVNPLEGV